MPKLKPTHISPAPAKVDLTKAQIEEIAATDMTFDEVEDKYGEDVAIRVGAARDPDNHELTAQDFATSWRSTVAPEGGRRPRPRCTSTYGSTRTSCRIFVPAERVGKPGSTTRYAKSFLARDHSA